MAICYVSNHGNLENDGQSFDTSKRSIQSALDFVAANGSTVYITGYYRESITFPHGVYLKGVGKCVIDGSLLDVNAAAGYYDFYDLTIQNFNSLFPTRGHVLYNCIIRNINNAYLHSQHSDLGFVYNTLINGCSIITIGDELISTTLYGGTISFYRDYVDIESRYNIYSNAEINHNKKRTHYYSLFHNCTFKFSGGGLGTDEVDFAAPIGSTDSEKLTNLRERMVAVYGGVASQYLQGCKYQTDGDLFINPDKENFYLVPGCLATRMSYEAQFVGKYPEASLADFDADFLSYTNIDSTGDITDQTVDASAETNIIDLGTLRHINSLQALGERATRNGNQVNVDDDLGAAINPGTNLTDGKTYIVRTEAISQTASGKTRDVGETFIATTADGLAFTSATGYVQEVYLDKPRSIEMKVSKTDPTLAAASWIKMDLYAEPRVNYDANGVVQYGNADVNYDEATSERMYIRYWKARITIKVKNLPS